MAMEAGLVLSLCDEDGSLELIPVDCGPDKMRLEIRCLWNQPFVEDLWMHPALLAAAAEADIFKLTSILFFW